MWIIFLFQSTVQDYREWLAEYEEESPPLVEDLLDNEEEEVESKGQKLVNKIKATENGVELKRILFSLKSIFQSDKGFAYEFVKHEGISALISLCEDQEEANQLQNLVLRALGQIMLYVDGMNGVMANPKAIEFLYGLTMASNPLVSKTAIKLLLVFVEYSEKNCSILLKAISEVDKAIGVIPWNNVIQVLKRDDLPLDLATFAMTLINRTLFAVPDQDTFYDHTDYMEELGMIK